MLFSQLMAASPKNFEPELEWWAGEIVGPAVQTQLSFHVVPKLLIYNDLRFAIEFEKSGILGAINQLSGFGAR